MKPVFQEYTSTIGVPAFPNLEQMFVRRKFYSNEDTIVEAIVYSAKLDQSHYSNDIGKLELQ